MSRLTSWWRHRRERILDEKARAITLKSKVPSALATEDATVDRDGVPIPPPWLRERVATHAGMSKYLDTGDSVASSIEDRFRDGGIELAAVRRLLDFGCGCGRVMRFLAAKTPKAHRVGVDVDADAVAWCAANLSSMASFRTIAHHPPTSEQAGAYDALVAISVFTHLPPAMQRTWVEEWARIVAPGGVLLFSLHHASDRKSPIAHRLKVVSQDHGSWYCHIGRQQEHPDWYQVTYHTEAAARRLVDAHFEVLRIRRKGIDNGQMSVLCRRRSPDPKGSGS